MPSDDQLARMKEEFNLGWLPTDEPVQWFGDEFLEAIKAGTVDGWTYDADGVIRFDDVDGSQKVWKLTGKRDRTGQEATWPDLDARREASPKSPVTRLASRNAEVSIVRPATWESRSPSDQTAQYGAVRPRKTGRRIALGWDYRAG
jgi:hypothetical protein